ncbi:MULTISPECIES: hypothetical protein [Sphingobacterium]|uniref:hypothetical protein n=1 Tax=Sphingobacterium TaxID=28453 RepID=UPI0008A339C8|nr:MULTISPECIES: hypothetical protein [Sphingobacterium]HAF36336.1 hypothetical protein [Sphingobacterium sp.]OFV19745.1 hypothetical protein HMPREF3127_03630 [Sphingobacterium sp. HMSC13C05]HAT94141.1 hypothetical protein [Sphingobacterium sp.]HAU55330.1 hypothetical protein [Sphingobacterium sp.]HCX56725.1 hypothetical protein [Sphingobacterium sp.]
MLKKSFVIAFVLFIVTGLFVQARDLSVPAAVKLSNKRNIISTENVGAKKNTKTNIKTLSSTFDFYVYNFSNSPIYLTFSGNFPGGTTQHVVVPANTLSYPVNIQSGNYDIYASCPSWLTMWYAMSCGHSGSGQSYTFENVYLSDTGCTSLDVGSN